MTVRLGQLYRENDPRGRRRLVKVTCFDRNYVEVKNLATGRLSRILRSTFALGGQRGWTLVIASSES